MINKYDAKEIALFTADSFRTRVSHLREDITGEEYEEVVKCVQGILESKVNNEHILDRQLDPKTGVVTDGSNRKSTR
jgi:hypothetical protein